MFYQAAIKPPSSIFIENYKEIAYLKGVFIFNRYIIALRDSATESHKTRLVFTIRINYRFSSSHKIELNSHSEYLDLFMFSSIFEHNWQIIFNWTEIE